MNEIKEMISLKFPRQRESIYDSQHLIIFETSKQKTWIFISCNSLYCVLDDITKNKTSYRWKIGKEKIIKDKQIILGIKIHPNYKKKTGKIDFGENHKGWLYNKNSFPDPHLLKERLEYFITEKMLK